MMFTTQQSIEAETAYRQERLKRDFQATGRKQRTAPAQQKPTSRNARRFLRPTTAA
ncbi:hypothetical protein [Kribbella italica]|uniref:Uncharacterized protein n=1 Tax=Kribbella italica TaxID=1540520 RepID=A0A7W9J9Y8_9ACTN|nr:hypothetical protein [Kribbella italica]MBB5838331.1 hypothetical protein [Kribbella italica]